MKERDENKKLHKEICGVMLQKQQRGDYGETFRDHLFEQYKIAIQGVDYTSNWKHTMNNYFLTIHSVLFAAVGISVAKSQIVIPELIHQFVPILGIFMVFAWWVTIRSYNDILEAKFSILHCIEEHLPLALYTTEWEILKASHRTPHRAARIETLIPGVFLILYILVFFFVK